MLTPPVWNCCSPFWECQDRLLIFMFLISVKNRQKKIDILKKNSISYKSPLPAKGGLYFLGGEQMLKIQMKF